MGEHWSAISGRRKGNKSRQLDVGALVNNQHTQPGKFLNLALEFGLKLPPVINYMHRPIFLQSFIISYFITSYKRDSSCRQKIHYMCICTWRIKLILILNTSPPWFLLPSCGDVLSLHHVQSALRKCSEGGGGPKRSNIYCDQLFTISIGQTECEF